jgi:hypothetical protein
MVHVVMHWHECPFPCHAKPRNQLVANVQKACECFEIVLLALKEILVHLRRDDILPFGQVDLLEALFQKPKQHRQVSLLVQGQAQNDLCSKLGRVCERKNSGLK